MKIVSDEERNAHIETVLVEGAKGIVIGAGVAFGLVSYIKKKHPARWNHFNTTIRSFIWSMPSVTLGAYFADEGSLRFDEEMYRSDYIKQQKKLELEKWEKMSTADRIFTMVNDNKYRIIVGAWAASLYGSWVYVNKDKYMTKSQKLVQARVYAQGFTVVLLLCTILLSMHEAELKKKEPAPIPEWKRYLEEHNTTDKGSPN